MRILLISQFYPPIAGGQERHVRDLGRALVDRGHELEVATIATKGDPGTTFDGPVAVHRLLTSAQRIPRLYSEAERPHATPVTDPRFRAGLERLVEGGRFDVLHAHDWTVNSITGISRRTGIPLVWTMHEYSHICATKRMMRAGSVCPGPAFVACVRCASDTYGPFVGAGVVMANTMQRKRRQSGVSAFVSVSSAMAERLGFDDDARHEVIPNFVPDEIVLDEVALDRIEDQQHPGPLVFVGDLTPDKGVGVLLAAYRRLADPPPLVLAGRVFPDTPSDRPPGVRVLGLVPPAKVTELMRGALVVVVPSVVAEACPTVVLEAMAAGRPVVAASSGGIPELVVDGATALVVAPGDVDALADALASLIADPPRANAMGRRGLERVRSYTASVVAEQVEALYLRLVRPAA